MAEVAAPGSQPSPRQTQQHATHGKKRAAEGPVENEQRLSKRFDLLNLENNGTRLYIPVPGSADPPSTATNITPVSAPHPLAATLPLCKSTRPRTHRPPRPRSTSTSGGGMQVEDTPHRVYIHDLAAELSDMESDEDNPIFLSDIEKHLSKIPRHILLGASVDQAKASGSTEHNQVVLYNVPVSLTVPQERDNVRKAIVEARQRIRDRQANPVAEVQRVHGAQGGATIGHDVNMLISGGASSTPLEADGDEMDID